MIFFGNHLISGEMQKRFQEIIEEQKAQADGPLCSRLCALVFLINKLPREGVDSGVRANAEHLADLLTDDLGNSAVELRQKIPPLLAQLVSAGVLMDIKGEYRLQTTEGAAWESEFRRRLAAAKNNDAQIAAQRGQRLLQAVQEALAKVLILHGAARVNRKVLIHHGMDPPPAGEGLVVWVRDGFQESEAAVISGYPAPQRGRRHAACTHPQESDRRIEERSGGGTGGGGNPEFQGQSHQS